jgi:hypothetical protein
MPVDADPFTEYLSYLSHVHAGAVGDMGFTLDEEKSYLWSPMKYSELEESSKLIQPVKTKNEQTI